MPKKTPTYNVFILYVEKACAPPFKRRHFGGVSHFLHKPGRGLWYIKRRSNTAGKSERRDDRVRCSPCPRPLVWPETRHQPRDPAWGSSGTLAAAPVGISFWGSCYLGLFGAAFLRNMTSHASLWLFLNPGDVCGGLGPTPGFSSTSFGGQSVLPLVGSNVWEPGTLFSSTGFAQEIPNTCGPGSTRLPWAHSWNLQGFLRSLCLLEVKEVEGKTSPQV